MISKEYQDYSGRDRNKGISQAIVYLNNQVALYKTKYQNSLNEAQKYAYDNDLMPLLFESSKEVYNIYSSNLELKRIQASNNIRNLNSHFLYMVTQNI